MSYAKKSKCQNMDTLNNQMKQAHVIYRVQQHVDGWT